MVIVMFSPPPDKGPTPEERRKQRELDKLKGFTYFDTFDQLYEWTVEDSDPIQRANTPFLSRPSLTGEETQNSTPVLLCHDYAGNYHEYEASQGAGIDKEFYSCEYLQFVDTFIYFSHKLACVPPPSWTNALHRNGVKVLGTLLIEPQTPNTERLLEHQNMGFDLGLPGGFPAAKRLADIANHYGFDGWLINVEKPFPKEKWNYSSMLQFLSELRKLLGEDKKLIWYDALTISNKVDYQNALNEQNSPFAQECGGILTNYCWKEKDAWNSKAFSDELKLPGQDIFVGIDVWAQNKSPMTRPRTTYPENGGGGTHTGMAVAKLAEVGLAAGIFGPAWTFEHFPTYGRSLEQAAWDGYRVPDQLECSCGDGSERHPSNPGYAIIPFACEYPAGSERFFHTDFDRGFWTHREELNCIYDGLQKHQQVAAQSILPHMAQSSAVEDDDQAESGINILSQTLEELVDSWDLAIKVRNLVPRGDNLAKFYERWLPLFKVRMRGDGSLKFKVVYHHSFFMHGALPAFYLKFSNGPKLMIPLHEAYSVQTVEAIVLPEEEARPETPPVMLQEIGVYLWARPVVNGIPLRLVSIKEMSITPLNGVRISCAITDLRIERRSTIGVAQWRLCWKFDDESEAEALHSGVPYSRVTGPFAHFLVTIDGLAVGRAFSTEYVLGETLVEKFTTTVGVRVVIAGMGFAGGRLADETAQLRIES